MNIPAYIAKRLSDERVTKPVIKVSVFSIALSIVVILIAFAIVRGFQKEVSEKIIGFGSHIQIRPFTTSNSLEQSPMSKNRDDITQLKSIPEIKSIYPFIEKGALIKTDSNLHGIVMKGIDKDFDKSFFEKNIVEGTFPKLDGETSNEILISKNVSQMLNLGIDSSVRIYYIMQGETMPRGRKYKVCGIYHTGMSDFDNLYTIGDIRHLQKINHWNDSLVNGFGITLNDFSTLDKTFDEVLSSIQYDLDATKITSSQEQLFNWLSMLDTNVVIILVLMTLVAIINVISIILMLILERISLIGLLKSLGANNGFIRKIFIYHSSRLLLKGIILGNIIGLGLILLQQHFHIIPLDQSMYYVEYVPVLLKSSYIISVNIGIAAISIISMILPSLIIRKINPAKALRHQ